MRFGINTFLLTSPFTNKSAKLFPHIKRWGFDTVEIPIEDPSHVDPALLKRQLEDAELICGSVCACTGKDRDLRGTPRQQKIGMDYLKKVVEQATEMGCPTIIGPVYSETGRAEAVPRAEYQRQWKTVVKNLKEISKQAEQNGRLICLEPLNRFETDFINTCDQGVRMIQDVDSPALKLMLDTFHMNIEEKNQAEAIRRASKHLAHLHACGCDRGTPGNDHIDWGGIAQALKEIGFQGDIVIEGFATHVKLIARAAAIWRQIEPTNEEIAVKGLKFLQRIL